MLGDIVHNEDVVRQIETAGIKKIGKLSKAKSGILLIRAHGSSLDIFTKAAKLGYEIIDATCLMVLVATAQTLCIAEISFGIISLLFVGICRG